MWELKTHCKRSLVVDAAYRQGENEKRYDPSLTWFVGGDVPQQVEVIHITHPDFEKTFLRLPKHILVPADPQDT